VGGCVPYRYTRFNYTDLQDLDGSFYRSPSLSRVGHHGDLPVNYYMRLCRWREGRLANCKARMARKAKVLHPRSVLRSGFRGAFCSAQPPASEADIVVHDHTIRAASCGLVKLPRLHRALQRSSTCDLAWVLERRDVVHGRRCR
jgi:hypothetical protein